MQWHQLDHMQTICTWLQRDDPTNTHNTQLVMLFLPPSQQCQSSEGTCSNITHQHKLYYASLYTHKHTHTFNGPLSGTTRVSRYHSLRLYILYIYVSTTVLSQVQTMKCEISVWQVCHYQGIWSDGKIPQCLKWSTSEYHQTANWYDQQTCIIVHVLVV